MQIPFILALQALSHTITVNTTSGILSGVQADGGMLYFYLLLSPLHTVTHFGPVASFKGIVRFPHSFSGRITEMALVSVMPSHPLGICAGNRQWHLFLLRPITQLRLVPRVFNNELQNKTSFSKFMMTQSKTRTASFCMLGWKSYSKADFS
jgi:hypothetical protein